MSVMDRIRGRGKKDENEAVEEVESTPAVILTEEEKARIQRSIEAGEAAYDKLSMEEKESLIDFASVAFPDETIETIEDGRKFIQKVVTDKTIAAIEEDFKKAERYIGLGKSVLAGNEKLGSRFDGVIIKGLERVAEGKVHLERVPSAKDAQNVEDMVKAASDAFFGK